LLALPTRAAKTESGAEGAAKAATSRRLPNLLPPTKFPSIDSKAFESARLPQQP
jgi:hypothetical protein